MCFLSHNEKITTSIFKYKILGMMVQRFYMYIVGLQKGCAASAYFCSYQLLFKYNADKINK